MNIYSNDKRRGVIYHALFMIIGRDESRPYEHKPLRYESRAEIAITHGIGRLAISMDLSGCILQFSNRLIRCG
jgi:hypothetical protein